MHTSLKKPSWYSRASSASSEILALLLEGSKAYSRPTFATACSTSFAAFSTTSRRELKVAYEATLASYRAAYATYCSRTACIFLLLWESSSKNLNTSCWLGRALLDETCDALALPCIGDLRWVRKFSEHVRR